MDNINDFSGIPALNDTAGMETFLQNEALAAQGLQPTTQTAETKPTETSQTNPTTAGAASTDTATNPAVGTTQQPLGQNTQSAPSGLNGIDVSNLSQEQLVAIANQLNRMGVTIQNGQPRMQPATAQGYTPQERQFISQALAQGYSLDQINATIAKHRAGAGNGAGNGVDPATTQRLAAIEEYLRAQEYKQAESKFIDKLSTFGEKFGLSEADLVTLGNAAYEKGINIAMPNVDLELVFKAIYPEQYRIRTQRMTPTNASQIYGGSSIPEGSRVQSARAEDAYVDSFLARAMPSQFQMLNKK